MIDPLIQGQYHDIIPNLIIKLAELSHQGYAGVALLIRNEIAAKARYYHEKTDGRISAILLQLDKVSLEHMTELEKRIMAMFFTVFGYYLGQYCYNSFVMMMDGATAKLRRDPSLECDKCLPALAGLDAKYGPTNCRPMDVLRLRIEIGYQRGQYDLVIENSTTLIERAYRKLDDPWQMHYYLFIGWYHRGSAQYFNNDYGGGKESLSIAQYMADVFSVIEPTGLFDSERVSSRRD